MHIIQRDGQPPLETFKVYYDGTEQLFPGYHVCWDQNPGITDPASDWSEKVRGRVIAKPATANLLYYAGIVLRPPQKRLDPAGVYKGWCTIIRPRPGSYISCRVQSNATAGTTYFRLTNDGGFALVDEATANTRVTNTTLAIAAETSDTSSTIANKVVFFLGIT